MRKNRLLLLGLLACGVGVAFVTLAWWERAGVTKEHFDRIEVGMTRAEVEAILGKPTIQRIGDDVYWTNDGYAHANIDFDIDSRVVRAAWFTLDDHRTQWEKLLDRLPWRKAPIDGG